MRKKISIIKKTLLLSVLLTIIPSLPRFAGEAGFCLAADNLLNDAGFEQSEPNGGPPDSGYWQVNLTGSGWAGCFDSGRSGENGLWLYTGLASDDRRIEIYQDIPARQGQIYFASAWVKTGEAPYAWLNDSRAVVNIRFLDAGKNPLVEYGSRVITDANTGWMLLYFAAKPAPSRTRFVRFVLSLEKPQLPGQTLAGFDDCILREIECSDCIRLDEMPPCGSSNLLKGSVTGVDTDDYSVGVYIFTDSWWPKPTFQNPWTNINPDGSWQCEISTSVYDLNATEIMAFLVPKSEIPGWPVDFNVVAGLSAMPGEAFRFPSVGEFRPQCHCKQIQFADVSWLVKSSTASKIGPGPNWFDCDNAWVDDDGLHLKITNEEDQWRCAEVFTEDSLGDGTYTFKVDAGSVLLDPNIIFGLFTWDEFAPHYANREIDIEIGRWGEPDNNNAQYVIQPSDHTGNLHDFNISPDSEETVTHVVRRGVGYVAFQSFFGDTPPINADDYIQSWIYGGNDVPRPGSENVRLNLWLNEGKPPSDGREAEVVITGFEFVPCTYEVSPDSIDFDSILIDSAVTKQIIIDNSAQCTPYLIAVEINGPDANNFLTADRFFEVLPGSSKQVDITFVPDSNRIYQAAVEITGKGISRSIPLVGRGVRFAFTHVPTVASPDWLEGMVSRVRFSDYRVASYVLTDRWYIKPFFDKSALRPINSNDAWKCDIDVEPTDRLATNVASFLVPKNTYSLPGVLNSLDDAEMSLYDRISATKPKLEIRKVTASVGKNDGEDSITIDGRYYITMKEFISTNRLCVGILQADRLIWTICVPFSFNAVISSKGFTYNNDGVAVTMKNFWSRSFPYEYAGNFRIRLRKKDLSCLRSPVAVSFELGDFKQTAIADEAVNEKIINGSRPIPIQFLSGCTDALRVDKIVLKSGSKSKGDYLYVKGAVVFQNAPPDLTEQDVTVGWGDASFTVPAELVKLSGRTHLKYACKKIQTLQDAVLDAFFDFKSCSFWIKISKAKLDTQSDAVNFNLALGGFSEGVSVKTNR